MRPRPLLVGLTSLVCLAAASTAAAADPEFVTQGSLLLPTKGKVVKVPLSHTRVRIVVSGMLARTTVTQTFKNPHRRKIEAIYVFPLPADSAVQAFTLKNGERVIRGKLLLKKQAQAVYRKARAAGQVAALLTQQRPNLFTQRVANLLPGVPVQVTVGYTSRLRYEAGEYELVFPMVVGPRFVPRKAGKRPALLSPPVLPPGLRSAHDIDLRVELDSGLPVERLRSPSHKIWTRPRSPSRQQVRLHHADRIPNRDFVLRYRVAGAAPRAALLTHRPRADQPGYLMLMVQPPDARRAAPALPRELVFVLDTSSSMIGAPLRQARALIRHALQRLRPRDTFQIVRFSDRSASLGPGMIRTTPRNLALAGQWLDRLQAGGGTRMATGLGAVLNLPHDPARLRLVVLLTDGYVGNESEILSVLSRRLGGARMFALGVGTAVNRYLLAELAVLGRGVMQVVRPDEPAGPAAERFYRRIHSPVLTDLKLRFEGFSRPVQLAERSPRLLPDLFSGQPLLLHARYTGAGRGALVLEGRRQGQTVRMRVPLTLPATDDRHPLLAAAWARARITDFSRQLLTNGDHGATRRRIIQLALAHDLLTRYTAFVAVDEGSFSPGESVQVRVPVERVQGLMHLVGVGSGQAYGVGGLGLVGTGRGGGGGGYGAGVVGHGTLQLIGKGGGGSRVASVFGSGYGAARALAPRVVLGQAVVTGSLDRELIRRIIRRHINEVRHCYQKELGARPTLAGKVVLRFTVEANGQVVAAQVAETTLGHKQAEACILRVVQRWRFPRVKGGGVAVINYPLVFKPASPAGGRP